MKPETVVGHIYVPNLCGMKSQILDVYFSDLSVEVQAMILKAEETEKEK